MKAQLRGILRDTYWTEERSNLLLHGNGGIWRRRQTDCILRRHAFEPINFEPPPRASSHARLLRALQLKCKFGRTLRWTRRSLGAAEYSYRFYRFNARRSGIHPVALLESGNDPIAVATLKEEGFRVIAVLCAIDSLWIDRPSRLTGPFPYMFLEETRALSKVDAVFCISREEQWLLNNLGIPAKYLPYYPDHDRAKTLSAERNERQPTKASAPREFLICATRNNSDVIDSFREQAELILRVVPEGDAIFNVTGNHTEEIRDIWTDRRFVFHGTCSPELFRTIKSRCVAICLHQCRGLGSLTRIPDMLLSGLAVIANGPAARSFIGLDGVYVYDTAAQLRELLRADIPMPPVPPPPVELEDDFFRSLQL